KVLRTSALLSVVCISPPAAAPSPAAPCQAAGAGGAPGGREWATGWAQQAVESEANRTRSQTESGYGFMMCARDHVLGEANFARRETDGNTIGSSLCAARCAASRSAQGWSGCWCHTVGLATLSPCGTLGGRRGAVQARECPARAWL